MGSAEGDTDRAEESGTVEAINRIPSRAVKRAVASLLDEIVKRLQSNDSSNINSYSFPCIFPRFVFGLA